MSRPARLTLAAIAAVTGVATSAAWSSPPAGAGALRASSTHVRTPPALARFTEKRLGGGAGLAAVACGSPSSCIVLDTKGNAYHYNGARWSTASHVGDQPRGPGSVSVACASRVLCEAEPSGATEIASWNGSSWSAPTTLEGAVGLEAVGCAPDGYCAAVDGEGNSFALRGTAWERSAGDWGSVNSISCVTTSFCVSASASGISIWSGSSWTLPATFPAGSSFTGVSCPSLGFCTAVGNTGNALRWNGSHWVGAVRIEPGRQSGTTLGSSPTAVSCPTSSFCVAVDNAGSILQWRNGSWSRIHRDGHTPLTAVSCPTTSLCVATDRHGTVIVARP